MRGGEASPLTRAQGRDEQDTHMPRTQVAEGHPCTAAHMSVSSSLATHCREASGRPGMSLKGRKGAGPAGVSGSIVRAGRAAVFPPETPGSQHSRVPHSCGSVIWND